jgi:hypothetical protein
MTRTVTFFLTWATVGLRQPEQLYYQKPELHVDPSHYKFMEDSGGEQIVKLKEAQSQNTN